MSWKYVFLQSFRFSIGQLILIFFAYFYTVLFVFDKIEYTVENIICLLISVAYWPFVIFVVNFVDVALDELDKNNF